MNNHQLCDSALMNEGNHQKSSIVITDDGSKTVYSGHFGEHYHSTFGAVNESNHVFIEAGYFAAVANPVSVLEIGFGTGLNAWLTLQQAGKLNRHTCYEAIELYPIDNNTINELSGDDIYRSLHTAPWEQSIKITHCFTLYKRKGDLLQTKFATNFDLVYFDAFSPVVQPEMWSFDIFSNLYESMNSGALLTTYCARGEVRRIMQRAGFTVERLPGPTGKREMLRARKA